MLTAIISISIVCIMLVSALLYVIMLAQVIADDAKGIIAMLSRENNAHLARIEELTELLASLPKLEPGAEDPYSIDNVED